MLENNDIIELARAFLLKNNYPIKGKAQLSSQKIEIIWKQLRALKKNIASVSFPSIYLYKPEHPKHELDPGIYTIYINYITGEVYMPPHM